MSYAIIRNANYKKDNLAGLYKHNERKNTNYSNKDIDKTKFIKNYSLKQCNTTYLNAIKKLQKENNLQGRIVITKAINVIPLFFIFLPFSPFLFILIFLLLLLFNIFSNFY